MRRCVVATSNGHIELKDLELFFVMRIVMEVKGMDPVQHSCCFFIDHSGPEKREAL